MRKNVRENGRMLTETSQSGWQWRTSLWIRCWWCQSCRIGIIVNWWWRLCEGKKDAANSVPRYRQLTASEKLFLTKVMNYRVKVILILCILLNDDMLEDDEYCIKYEECVVDDENILATIVSRETTDESCDGELTDFFCQKMIWCLGENTRKSKWCICIRNVMKQVSEPTA